MLLSEQQLHEQLAELNQGEQAPWVLQQGKPDKLHRDFIFQDFSEAFAFMTRVALCAEHQNHHPEWRNVYSRVSIELTTHDCGGLSAKDIQLAQSINRLLVSSS